MFKEILNQIVDADTGKPAVGMNLIKGISNEIIKDEYVKKWKVHIDRLKKAPGVSNRKKYQEQQWPITVSQGNQDSDVELFRLEFNGELQAMMALSKSGKPYPNHDFPDSSKQNKLIYLRHLEVAPWNQSAYEKLGLGKRKFVGGGIATLNCVRIICNANGYDGCFGLHALTNAEPFYKKLVSRNSTFDRIGTDKRVGNKGYFEYDPNLK